MLISRSRAPELKGKQGHLPTQQGAGIGCLPHLCGARWFLPMEPLLPWPLGTFLWSAPEVVDYTLSLGAASEPAWAGPACKQERNTAPASVQPDCAPAPGATAISICLMLLRWCSR